jgi:hypothetical protein
VVSYRRSFTLFCGWNVLDNALGGVSGGPKVKFPVISEAHLSEAKVATLILVREIISLRPTELL